MARKKQQTEEQAPEVAEAAPAAIPTTFTEEQQNAYARDAQTTGARNVRGYADIHDWYRRTRGGKENG